MKRHSAPTQESRPASPPAEAPPPLPPRLASPIHPSRPPYDDESDATSLTSVGSDGAGGGDKVKAAQSFEALFNSEKLSDFLLDVNQGLYVFHAHKMIVGLKSERLAALITTSASSGGGGVSNSNTSGSLSTSVHNYISGGNNTSTFTAGNAMGDKGKSSPCESPGSGCIKPTLYLQETPECGAVFGRFLYFIYSGAVWLHRDYVLPLHALSVKYGVAALASHCENYIQQLLHKCLQAFDATSSAANQSASGTAKTAQPAGTLLSATAVCDVYESGWDMFSEGTRRDAFSVLTRRFPELCHTERWAGCVWATVRDLLRSDACACDENVMLVAATDWMKRTRLQDKARIQELLSSIRYPRLPRRVLYHLYTTASFRNFPPVQALIEAAIRYHCFRDVPEARDEFTGRQYRARGGRPASRHVVCGNEHPCCKAGDNAVATSDSGDMSSSNTSSNATTASHVNSSVNPHDIAQPNEWGCYGDPLDESQGSGSDDRCNGDSNNNVEQHHQRAGVPVSNSSHSPDLVSDPRNAGNQQQHPQQCRGCYDGRPRHQGSPVAAVQPRVHTPPEEDDRLEGARQAGPPHSSMTSSAHMVAARNGDNMVRLVDAMNSTSDLQIQPPPFTRV
ncbi:hypothetical protein RRG08_016259 [Elysia crispata]|uniref:BTB domain-containing protein n=1 Tax=Elysia crispata TaxID=231223 RepID=A0AAE1ALX3_9GAST|nr:hypothetical protein RRG08_016259 [Elysia crispata]